MLMQEHVRDVHHGGMLSTLKLVRNSTRSVTALGWAIGSGVLLVTLCYVVVGFQYFWD
jgi:hypothetical protein